MHNKSESFIDIKVSLLMLTGEQGELVGIIKKEHPFREFHGYADEAATKKKILRNVLKPGDTAFKSGIRVLQFRIKFVFRSYILSFNCCGVIGEG